jgi:hypothetical protein
MAKRRYSSKPSAMKRETPGRIALVVIFLLFLGLDLGVYFTTPEEQQHELLGQTIVRQLWTFALLGAIWCGQNWARYVLIALLMLGALFFIPVVMELIDLGLGISPFAIFWIVVNLSVMAAMIYLPAIRDLTHRR